MHASRIITAMLVVLGTTATLASCTLALDGVAEQPAQQSAPGSGANNAVPTPTFVPVQALQPPRFEGWPPAAASSGAPPAPGAPTAEAPTGAPTTEVPAGGQPTAEAPTGGQPAAPQPTPPTLVGGAQSLRLDDDAWFGGWKQGKSYGGRSATWIYGTGTEYNTMEAAFELAGQPAGGATLSIEGMDGENVPKMSISILVNDSAIYTGLNPLPDDDHDLATGTWATYGWNFDAALLRPGLNRITIVALSDGGFGQPPFMMLDYADLSIEG